jgi:hypothetical protein
MNDFPMVADHGPARVRNKDGHTKGQRDEILHCTDVMFY